MIAQLLLPEPVEAELSPNVTPQSAAAEEVRLDPRNIIFGSEFNPFDVYRQVRRTVLHYHSVLGLVGGCRVALSAMCSKVMSLAILLVAYEFKPSDVDVGIAHIACQGYEVPAKPRVRHRGGMKARSGDGFLELSLRRRPGRNVPFFNGRI